MLASGSTHLPSVCSLLFLRVLYWAAQWCKDQDHIASVLVPKSNLEAICIFPWYFLLLVLFVCFEAGSHSLASFELETLRPSPPKCWWLQHHTQLAGSVSVFWDGALQAQVAWWWLSCFCLLSAGIPGMNHMPIFLASLLSCNNLTKNLRQDSRGHSCVILPFLFLLFHQKLSFGQGTSRFPHFKKINKL